MGDECRRVKKQSRNLELKLNRPKNLGKIWHGLQYYSWFWPLGVQLASLCCPTGKYQPPLPQLTRLSQMTNCKNKLCFLPFVMLARTSLGFISLALLIGTMSMPSLAQQNAPVNLLTIAPVDENAYAQTAQTILTRRLNRRWKPTDQSRNWKIKSSLMKPSNGHQ